MRNPYEDDLLSTDWSTMTVGQMWDAIGEFDRHPASEQSGGWNRAFERGMARLVGHEIDHLEGKLYTDRMTPGTTLVPLEEYRGTGTPWRY